MTTRPIRINAFGVHGPVHHSPGLRRHPRDRSREHNRLEYWTDLARTLERGKFDSLFLADNIGANDVFGGNVDAALRVDAGRSSLAHRTRWQT